MTEYMRHRTVWSSPVGGEPLFTGGDPINASLAALPFGTGGVVKLHTEAGEYMPGPPPPVPPMPPSPGYPDPPPIPGDPNP